ncbi:TPA: leucyl/phenylalanyl-tRNA--protein transferase [Xanthomonas vasicola pv. zeae]|uniref:Leucyl/phenylalanyl-tRNA--protein transferase n=1 Tax=Xanthomonas vasicola pv. vasculorum TaxID=325776 RepID=A0AAE8JWR2_XANVA|nr:leucyl/phenylalanyl-tRNA--protein transferase [Xanthomonas vasicola]AVQ07211.1 leucyl/phenylalanyl-tRNA--protein transferase [Xanthomonas vasicola pv. vasculorum]AZM71411.1 leucyl/phenylalanyl-tRNA--protein transferase [Xanthomonas vasicola pv. vasculorum]MDO6956617.1 leucyl/phenylalanyl-tRNA--protein transferase [Xanthomonas vasicola]MDO6973549.1 leucyl/phenylalanyl-tRNA--protein transferase [Xanthomonas vasicola]OWF58107.1 leucyl/phenylalanyl-tRNA--protein transferase [Xanthomonas vasicol
MTRHLPFLLDPDPAAPFPPAAQALRDPDGLLAIGGDLSPQRLLNAYTHGIFPWFSDGQPILWWSPDPRMVFRTDALRLSSRFKRQLRSSSWTIRADTAFEQVINACASVPRPGQDGTWITAPMQQAYIALHRLGHAHSFEVFDGTHLIGGIYGVAIGQMFFGESMFSVQSGGSKVALAALAAYLQAEGWPLLDAQVENPHLLSLGAQRLPRAPFLQQVELQVAQPAAPGAWSERYGERPASALGEGRLT